MKEIIKLCKVCFGVVPERSELLAGAGSSRRYVRLYLPENKEGSYDVPRTVVATAGEDIRENRAFIDLSRVFQEHARLHGQSLTPRIYAVSDSGRVYLQEDLGPLSFLEWMESVRRECDDADIIIEESVKDVLTGLLRLQTLPANLWKDAVMAAPFGIRRIESDLHYFKNCFLRPSGVGFNEERLDMEIGAFADAVATYQPEMTGFMMRDFQSRNVMVHPDSRYPVTPVFIDYQGGMSGPMIYDAISFLWQAKARFSSQFRHRMLEFYAGKLEEMRDISMSESLGIGRRLILLRLLQVLGAYGFRGLIEHKSHFLESINPALGNLREALDEGMLNDFPELQRCCRSLVELERFHAAPHEGLRVEILSFSYKKGYPENLTGNGGGFVFDCRGMHNPGRYEEYKGLTGRDLDVIDFLEERGEVQDFMKNVFGLVVPTVETYLRRGFSDLQVAFGCTGGRHRSVYCAESLARELRRRFSSPEILLIHREQGIRKFIKL